MTKKDKKVVVISGKQFSGKDTVANVLNKILPDFKLAPIADAIKIEFSQKKNLTFNEIERNKPLYRADLISFSNEKRSKDPNCWIKKVLSYEDNLIVSDVRLQHEIKTFEKLGAVKIRIESAREERAKRGRLVKEDDFTETDLDNYKNWDYIIENNGSVKDLEDQAAKVGEKVRKTLSAQKV